MGARWGGEAMAPETDQRATLRFSPVRGTIRDAMCCCCFGIRQSRVMKVGEQARQVATINEETRYMKGKASFAGGSRIRRLEGPGGPLPARRCTQGYLAGDQFIWRVFSLLLAMYFSLNVGYWLTLLLALPTAGFLVRIFIIQHDCGHGSFSAANVPTIPWASSAAFSPWWPTSTGARATPSTMRTMQNWRNGASAMCGR